jgi:lipopolysaccharide biosynthesis regulator YciM
MRYDFNILEAAAQKFMETREFNKAIRVYLFMADGDQSLDGGYIGEKLGQCYEGLGDLSAAKYWYGRAVEENPEARTLSAIRRKSLEHIGIDDIVNKYILPSNE